MPWRTLLGVGVIAPILFVAVLLIEGATRPGYSALRNYGSSLALGDGGWVQVANFLVGGALFLACAFALIHFRRRAVGVLVALFALMLIVAGIFPTDPGLGYPPGAPEEHTAHGAIHALSGLGVFLFSTIAAIVAAVQLARRRDGWALVPAVAAAVSAVSFFVSMAAAASDEATGVPGFEGLYQRFFIVAAFAWIGAFAYHVRERPRTTS